ncbi:hypothetical protein [Candidatus Fukatsuia endosymbiont of Tuberolachnus salignus]|uniref:alpha/beta hydrolase n=1 Tax=Candidatus Fukatsuia endosymbiont of Tuberolachnus salignus TaxID=3077957 RepID=UPI00313D8A41
MYKKIGIIIMIMVILGMIYLSGPKPAVPIYDPTLPVVPKDPVQLVQYIQEKEKSFRIKPNNEARILWFNPAQPSKTACSMVYLHGFSASQQDGDPIHFNTARRYGCNLYLSRLDEHGLVTTDPLLKMTVAGLWKDAKEALSIRNALGNKVILISTSTGSTLALKLAAEFPNDVAALINLSPNVAINDPFVFMINNPWGLQFARLIKNGRFQAGTIKTREEKKYWYQAYRLEAVVQLQNLLESTMHKLTFDQIRQLVLNLYYYKDEQQQDSVVKVPAILKMHQELATEQHNKRTIAIPNANTHTLGSGMHTGDLPTVENAINKFVEEVLKLSPALNK